MSINVEAAVPHDDLIRVWVQEAGGQMDGDTAILKMDEMKVMITSMTKIIGGVMARAIPEMLGDDRRDPRSPNDMNPTVLKALTKMADRLQTMREAFKGDEGWQPMLVEIEATLKCVRKAMIVALGSD